MTPHRFRHTIASDLMKQPDRNIHVTKTLLNHTNLATTMEYIEPDYDVMRAVLNERTPIRGLVEFMEKREGYRQNLNGRSLGNPQYSVGGSPTRLLKIDRSPPLAPPQLVEKSAISTHSALALPSLATQMRSDTTPIATRSSNAESHALDEPLSADEIAFVGKFLDWLRHRGVDSGAQLLLDTRSSLSEQLRASKGSFEGIAWVNRPT